MGKARRLLFISLSISILTIAVLIYLTATEGIVESLMKINPVFLLLALGAHVFSWFFWTFRIKAFAKTSDMSISFIRTMKIILSSTFAAAITPSYAGGEPVRLYLLSKEEGCSGGIASAIVISERTLDMIFLVIFGTFGMFVIRETLADNIGLRVASTFAALLFLILASILAISLFKPDKIKKIVSYFERPIEKIKPGVMKKVYNEIDSYNAILWEYLRNHKKMLVMGFIFTVGLWGLEFSIPYIILTGLGLEIDFLMAWSGYIVVMLIVMIPTTPGGSGVAEIGASLIYSAMVGTALIGVFVLLWRLVTYYVNLGVGGLVTSIVVHDMARIEEEIE